MAARDILTLDKPIASRLIRCLYIFAMVLITVLVIFGLIRGVRVMTLPPMPRPPIANNQTQAAPGATQLQPPAGMMGPVERRRMFMERRFRRPIGPFGMGRNPVMGGLFIILATLVRGLVALLVVRILAELGLAILAMPRRSET
jgi:hypothetical protein